MALTQGQVVTIAEVLDAAKFDLKKEAAVDYNDDGVDMRRVKVGGLSFDNTEESFRVAGDSLEVTLDGEVVATLDVDALEDSSSDEDEE